MEPTKLHEQGEIYVVLRARSGAFYNVHSGDIIAHDLFGLWIVNKSQKRSPTNPLATPTTHPFSSMSETVRFAAHLHAAGWKPLQRVEAWDQDTLSTFPFRKKRVRDLFFHHAIAKDTGSDDLHRCTTEMLHATLAAGQTGDFVEHGPMDSPRRLVRIKNGSVCSVMISKGFSEGTAEFERNVSRDRADDLFMSARTTLMPYWSVLGEHTIPYDEFVGFLTRWYG